MQKVLILGGTGMLGVNLASFLKALGEYEVFVHGSKNANGLGGDLTQLKYVQELIQPGSFDLIVNLVALTNVDECERNPQSAYLLNVKVVENIVACLQGNQETHLIQVSTDQVYDGKTELNSEERVCLTNYYAFSKYAGEIAASKAGSTTLRTNFFGRSNHSVRTSFTDWLYTSTKSGQSINLFSDVIFSPLHISTLCRCIESVMRKKIPGCFNVGSRGGLSKADFAIAFAKKEWGTLNYQISSSQNSSLKAYRPKNMAMVVSNFEQAFEMHLPTIHEEIIKAQKEYR